MWFKKCDSKPLIYKCGLKSISSDNFVNMRTLLTLEKCIFSLWISNPSRLAFVLILSNSNASLMLPFSLRLSEFRRVSSAVKPFPGDDELRRGKQVWIWTQVTISSKFYLCSCDLVEFEKDFKSRVWDFNLGICLR